MNNMNGKYSLERDCALNALVKKLGDSAYIGFGNPASNLLILGKECARKMDATSEIIDNFSVQHNSKQWKKYLLDPQGTIKEWPEVPYERMEQYFNPRFAFYGQQFHCRRTKKDDSGETIDNKGTSRTWYFYQKLINLVRGNEEMHYGDKLDFQDYCFISDLSDYSKPMSRMGDLKRTANSIVQRSSDIFSAPFFQAFPVVMGAFGNYMQEEQLRRLFPNAKLVMSKQLSMNFTSEYLTLKAEELKKVLIDSGLSL